MYKVTIEGKNGTKKEFITEKYAFIYVEPNDTTMLGASISPMTKVDILGIKTLIEEEIQAAYPETKEEDHKVIEELADTLFDLLNSNVGNIVKRALESKDKPNNFNIISPAMKEMLVRHDCATCSKTEHCDIKDVKKTLEDSLNRADNPLEGFTPNEEIGGFTKTVQNGETQTTYHFTDEEHCNDLDILEMIKSSMTDFQYEGIKNGIKRGRFYFEKVPTTDQEMPPELKAQADLIKKQLGANVKATQMSVKLRRRP